MSGFFDGSDASRRPPELVSPHRKPKPLSRWRRGLGCFFLLAGMGMLLAGAWLFVSAPPAVPAQANPTATALPARATATATAPPPQSSIPLDDAAPTALPILPTLSGAQRSALLATPPPAADASRTLQTSGLHYDPFTIIPQRARSRMTTYVVAAGDTMDAIAGQFGLERETLAWCNDYRLALVLHPGDVVNVPPTDGACHTVLASQGKDIRAIAAQYEVEDPYAVIDSPANALSAMTPESQLPSGTRLFIPGGVGAIITWDAPVEQDGAGNVIAFAPGQAGSCGAVAGGGSFWANPLPGGTFVRGFYAGHSGIDIAATSGTPIFAANGGPVLYAGWNSWGYGNTVVIGHGPFSTLYGHMSRLALRCGDWAAAGQIIGYVGSTGNSSGPHLHFEIRYRNQPQDPIQTPGIGW